ncbi:MAG: hypothetical protein KDE33_24710 [Bacteroidetes bacterium]|nr:hypothetical protein [Bacteroidota bacterium]
MKWDGKEGVTAEVTLSLVQTILVADLIIIPVKIIYDSNVLIPYSRTFSIIGVGLCILLMIYNHFRYKDRFDALEKRYLAESDRKKKLRGIMVIVSIVMPLVILFLIGLI